MAPDFQRINEVVAASSITHTHKTTTVTLTHAPRVDKAWDFYIVGIHGLYAMCDTNLLNIALIS